MAVQQTAQEFTMVDKLAEMSMVLPLQRPDLELLDTQTRAGAQAVHTQELCRPDQRPPTRDRSAT